MSKDPFQSIARRYDGLVGQYGHDSRACDYGRPESQLRKFAVLAGVMPLRGKSVLDVGCGFADYADYLEEHAGDVHYTGLDLSPRMIDLASRRRPDLNLRVGNILDENAEQKFDVVNANGIFYLLGDRAPDLMRSLIRRMFAAAKEAVAFNSLSIRASHHEPGEYYANAMEIFDFCCSLTPWVVVRHDYLPHDFTVYMYRRQENP